MNLLAAASFGVLTAFFEWGWGTSAFGLGRAGPIEAYMPVVTLAILFGLSMDYQVFLVSRIAFVLRAVLVPAAMHLFGRANWWLPRRLDGRLPHLAIEPPAEEPPAEPPVRVPELARRG